MQGSQAVQNAKGIGTVQTMTFSRTGTQALCGGNVWGDAKVTGTGVLATVVALGKAVASSHSDAVSASSAVPTDGV